MSYTILAVGIVLCISCIRADPLVILEEGYVRGTSIQTRNGRWIYAFTGVPYAEAPVGHLRFRNPVPKKPWRGVFAANTSTQCPQQDEFDQVVGEEDCLQLNIYTPWLFQRKQPLLPVMVYIHGGGFYNGNSSFYTPTYLLDKNIVLLTMNYRLGILGFISTGDQAAPGNFGYKDQLLALKWTQRNIKAFGGDPGRVTLTGQSAGGMAVNHLALSDKTDGLFQQYIIQSGSTLSPVAFRRDVSAYYGYAKKAAAYCDCPTDDSKTIIECLRGVDVKKLVLTNFLFGKMHAYTLTYWGPTIEPHSEDAILTNYPGRLIRQRKMKDLKLLTGVVRDEGLYVTGDLYYNQDKYEYYFNNIVEIITDILWSFGFYPREEVVSSMKDFYVGEKVSKNRTKFIHGITDFVTDATFVFGEMALINYLQNIRGSPMYFYSFEYRGTMSEQIADPNNPYISASHADDLIYLFPLNPEKFGVEKNTTLSESDYKIVDTMVDLWTSFVINGVPMSRQLQDPYAWIPYSDSRCHLRIGHIKDPTSELQHSFQSTRMAFWYTTAPEYGDLRSSATSKL